jgi:hypothetical protein
MKRRGMIVFGVTALALSFLLWGCGKPEEQTAEEADTNSAQREAATANSGQPAATPAAAEAVSAAARHPGGSEDPIEQVRAAFLSLQQVCKANDVDGYVAFWDDETKRDIDGRDLTVAQRQEQRRQRLVEKPGDLQEIAKATIQSIKVDTSQAEKLEQLFHERVEGAMIVVFTDGPALLFHETSDGWKLFTKSTGSYFREG